jgi:hypothetical protein
VPCKIQHKVAAHDAKANNTDIALLFHIPVFLMVGYQGYRYFNNQEKIMLGFIKTKENSILKTDTHPCTKVINERLWPDLECIHIAYKKYFTGGDHNVCPVDENDRKGIRVSGCSSF